MNTESSKRRNDYWTAGNGTNGSTDLVTMPSGLIGFEECRLFAWSSPSNPRLAGNRVLRCIDRPDLAFLVVPAGSRPELVGHDVLEQAAGEFGVSPAHAEWFLIVTPWFADDAMRMTANLRAPVLLDHATGTARQIVLADEHLPCRRPI